MARFVETVVFWMLLTGLWLLTLSGVSRAELVAAIGLGLPCALVAGVARRAVGASWAWPRGWLRWWAPLPAAVVADTARILAGLTRRPVVRGGRGRLERVAMPAESDPRRAAARRAASVVVLSCSPGSVVVDETGDELVVHMLAAGRPRMIEVVRR